MRATALIAKLERFILLSADEKSRLNKLVDGATKTIEPRTDLYRFRDRPGLVNVILEGWASRYIDLEDGARQIVAFMVPGDFCDLGMANFKFMDHSIAAVSRLTVAQVPHREFEAARQASPHLDLAFQWAALVELAIARQWVLSAGHRSAVKRIAHLFCELRLRQVASGIAEGWACAFPATQQQIGEATGLSSVHVNRSLQQLRADGLIALRGKVLTILDVEGLEDLAEFDPTYLHLDEGVGLSG